MPTRSPWRLALEALENGQSAQLVIVVDHRGSVPGTTGVSMVVTTNETAGTIGGGLVEHTMIEMARTNPTPGIHRFQHDGKESDSVCSGRQDIALLRLGPGDLPAIKNLVAIDKAGGAGTLTVRPNGISAIEETPKTRSFTHDGEAYRFLTPIGLLDTLSIIGGGHVSLALSRVMATLPFRILVFDDRPNLPTVNDNRWAHRFQQLQWEDLAEVVPQGNRSWAVIMTAGHRHDTEALRHLINLDLRYLGLMGSAAKVHEVHTTLTNEGVGDDLLAKIHTPIGVPIGSHTPEEIAISIAAEIVAIRNGKI